jgi:hypothetical protein
VSPGALQPKQSSTPNTLYERKIPVVSAVSRHDIDKTTAWSTWNHGKDRRKTGVDIISEQDAAVQFAELKPDVHHLHPFHH